MLHRQTPSVHPFLPLVCLTAALAAQSPWSGKAYPFPADRSKGAESVTLEDCKAWLYKLASPEFEGRQTGQPGFQKAADYVAAHFRKVGLEARGPDGTYFQQVPWAATKIDHDKTFVAFAKDGAEVLRIPAERLAGTASGTITADGDVVLLVIPAPEVVPGQRFQIPKIPELQDLDVEGKIVVAYVQTKSEERTAAALGRLAVRQELAGKQPAALLFAQDAATTTGLVGSSGAGRRAGNPAIAGASRSPLDVSFGGDDLQKMLVSGGQTTEVLHGTGVTPTFALKAHVEVTTASDQAPAMNVWGVLPGSDPKRKDEYVVIGSHLDHKGMMGGLHPGADDDGSGTTGVLALSTMFTKNNVRPARSILFVCFCGEEDGLIGSAYFAKNCPVPLSSIVGELQMDMIGRDEEENREGNRGEKAEDNRTSLHLIGTQKLAPALHALCLKKNETAGFDIEYDEERMFGRSDHANFAKMGVPIAFFFTGLHRDYHQTTDTPDKIHYEKLLRVAHYVYDIAFDLAQQDGRPEIDPALWASYRGKVGKDPAAPMMPASVQPTKGDR